MGPQETRVGVSTPDWIWQTAPRDWTVIDKTIEGLYSLLRHRREKPTDKSDERYYEMVIRYFERLIRAEEEGKKIAYHLAYMPHQLARALDMVTFHLEGGPVVVGQMTGNLQESLSEAKAFGCPPESCSNQRNLTGLICMGGLPRPDAFFCGLVVCDSHTTSFGIGADLWGVPSFFIDIPYHFYPKDLQYVTTEMEDLVQVLEGVAGKKMDWDLLKHKVKNTQRLVELGREIANYRKAIPSPMRGRKIQQLHWTEMCLMGEDEAVSFFELVLGEIKERVERGISAVPEEKYRLLTLFYPPVYGGKILDWMEREQGAVSVWECPGEYSSSEGDLDPEKPLESLARWHRLTSFSAFYQGPLKPESLDRIAQAAIEHKAVGAIYWAHQTCRYSCQPIRPVKEALMEEAGVPMLVIDMDYTDPTFTTPDQIREKMEGFFEELEDRR
ncbi:MAG: 2-hydroxyacyl-CoA dehydratase subunit D [Dehalococcoidia bacterium]